MTEVKQELKIGEEIDDGTILVGYYDGKPLYTTSGDATRPPSMFSKRLTFRFNEAQKYARRLNKEKFLGHDDWRVPTEDELNVLWENRNKGKLKGTFNETGSNPAGWYWSSTPNSPTSAWALRFSDGSHLDIYRLYGSSLRLVR